MIQVVRVSGTIKKVEEEAVRLARRSIVRARKGNEEPEEDFEINAMAGIDSDGGDDEG